MSIKGNNMKDAMANIEAYMASPEGKASIDDYFSKLKEKDNLLKKRFLRFEKWLETNSFDNLMTRLIDEHDESWRDKAYKRGYEPSFNRKLYFVISYIRENFEAINVSEFDNDFYGGSHFFKGYYFTTYHGQGCFTRIHNHKKEEILQE